MDQLPDDPRLLPRPPHGPARTAGRWPTTGSPRCAGRFRDEEHGGWYAKVGRRRTRSRPTRRPTSTRSWCSPARERHGGRPAGRARAAGRALGVLRRALLGRRRRHGRRAVGRVVDTLDGYRGVNANMHTRRGAALRRGRARTTPRCATQAQRILTRVVHDFARGNQWRIPEHFDATWTPVLDYNVDEPAHPFRPYGATIGHWLEWARLALHLRAGLGRRGTRLAARRRGRALRGLRARGLGGRRCATASSTPSTGTVKPVVRERMHWVAAEATATAAALHAATGDPAYAALVRDLVGARRRPLPRRPSAGRGGTSCRRTTGPSGLTWAGKPDTYHAVQATLLPASRSSPTLAAALAQGLLD